MKMYDEVMHLQTKEKLLKKNLGSKHSPKLLTCHPLCGEKTYGKS